MTIPPVIHLEFASFAMLAMPRHRSDPALTPPTKGEAADFRVGAAPSAQFVARSSFLKTFFWRHQAQDLRQFRAPRNLTN